MKQQSELQKYRKWVDNDHLYNDEIIVKARKLSLDLAPFLLEKMKHLFSFITRRITIDAKARIVK